MRLIDRLLAGAFLACSVASPSLARYVADGAADDRASASRIVYEEDFFLRFEVNSAEDMLRRIPGVPAILDAETTSGQKRGFGSTGAQILINGRRFPGKSNEITANLRRIPAANVERVELIRGAAPGIEVQSEGVVVNLVMRPDASLQGAGSYEMSARFNGEGYFDIDGLLTYNSTIGRLSYNVGIERNLWSNMGSSGWTHRDRAEVYYYPDGTIQELRPQSWKRTPDRWIYTGGLIYDLPSGDRASLNALYDVRHSQEIDRTPLIRFDAQGRETLRAREDHDRELGPTITRELGGEYASGVGPGALTVLAILRRVTTPISDFRKREEPTRTIEVSRSRSRVKTGEDIVRATYAMPVVAGQSVELGGEAARNTLDQDLQAFFDLDRNGTLEPVVMPISRPHVEEARGEVFLSHKWSVNQRLSLDSSLNYEFSKLTTNYPLQPTRTLRFLKPRLDLRYKRGEQDQLRFLVERTVSQLDFANFVPSYNVVDDRIEAGNPGLAPEKTWRFEVGYERRLPDDGGVLEARLFYDTIKDPIDKAPLFTPFLVSASGNLDSAKRYGAEGKASLRLTALGLRDAVLSLRALRQHSEVLDPFTGAKRRLKDDRVYAYDISFRHDVLPLRMAYGFTYKSLGTGVINSDLLVREYYKLEPLLEVFIEKQVRPGAKLRLDVYSITRSPETRSRVIYAQNALHGVPRRVDFYREERDMRAAVTLRGRF